MNLLRTVVSGPKQRFVDKADHHDLDLVYLTDRIILMGYPASGLEAMYRNKMAYVLAFLDAKHRDHYRVFNLCPLGENSYEPTSFHGRISRYPFPDHHAPPLALLHLATEEMELFLGADEKNVVAIHCKAGKGRTGTLACSLIERLGGASAAKKVHGMLNGAVHVPGRKEDPRELVDNGEADEGGSVSLPAPGSEVSEEPILSSSPQPGEEPSSALVEKKHKKKKSTSKKLPALPVHPAAETLDFHTSRRMASPNLLKPGVSIPSQRRFLHYFVDSLALARQSPRSLYPGRGRPKPMLRLKEVILVNAHPAKDPLTPKVRGEVARYPDLFVASLEDSALAALTSEAQKKVIVDGAGGLGIGMSGVGTDAVGGEDEQASTGGAGMIRGIGALREEFTETGEMDWDAWGERSKDLAMYTHHLKPETELVVHPDRELKVQVFLGAEHQSVKSKPSNLLARGVRGGILNVLLGQNTSSLGWLWLVPSFHIPSLATDARPTSEPEEGVPPQTHTLTFPREIVDFRSKTLRSVSLVFEELQAPSSSMPTPSEPLSTPREGLEKGEVLPPDSQRNKAEEGGVEGAVGGTEHK